MSTGNFTLQTKTCLEQAGNNFVFLVGDYNNNGTPDVFAIKINGTGSKKTEVHILDGASKFSKFLLHAKTALEETDDKYEFCLGDYNKDGFLDLYCIRKNNTGSHSTEVHILSGKDKFNSFLLHTGTKLEETDKNWKFGLSDFNGDGKLDLFCIKKANTGSNKTEVHILGGNDNFKKFIFQGASVLETTDDKWDFFVYQNNVYGIKKRNTGSHHTEIHVLSAESKFKNFKLQKGTKLEEAEDDVFAFDVHGDQLYAIKKKGNSNTTEVHCLHIQL